MKYLIAIITICFFSINTTLFSYDVVVNRNNGGQNGYKVVQENHDTNDGTSNLNCQDPGHSSCDFVSAPEDVHNLQTGNGTDIPWEDLENYAIDEIDLGNLTGNHTANITLDGELWYRSVSWDATGSYDNEITININPASSN